jgi:rod shape-determining protein MreB and related proteins
MLSKPLYVQIRANQFRVRNINDSRTVERKADPEFSHPRMLVGNFTVAQECLKAAMAEARGSMIALSVPVVIHPLEKIEGGLTQVEERLFHELAMGAGASKVVVWVGDPLSDADVLAKFRKR